MAIDTLEARVERLENKLREVEARLQEPDSNSVPKKTRVAVVCRNL